MKCANPECGNIAKRGKFCSHACFGASIRKHKEKECPGCHLVFRPRNSWDKYCSIRCSSAVQYYEGDLAAFDARKVAKESVFDGE